MERRSSQGKEEVEVEVCRPVCLSRGVVLRAPRVKCIASRNRHRLRVGGWLYSGQDESVLHRVRLSAAVVVAVQSSSFSPSFILCPSSVTSKHPPRELKQDLLYTVEVVSSPRSASAAADRPDTCAFVPRYTLCFKSQ